MLNQALVARAVQLQRSEPPKPVAPDRVAYARIVAGSHRLEGMDTTTKQVLEASESLAPRERAAAS